MSNISDYTTDGGVSFSASPYAGPQFLGFLNGLENAGAPVGSVGGYNYRNIAGTNKLSQHAFGDAIDIDQQGRNISPRLAQWAQQNPDTFRGLLARYGLTSGGDWHNPDFGHFELANHAATASAPKAPMGPGNSSMSDTYGAGPALAQYMQQMQQQGQSPLGPLFSSNNQYGMSPLERAGIYLMSINNPSALGGLNSGNKTSQQHLQMLQWLMGHDQSASQFQQNQDRENRQFQQSHEQSSRQFNQSLDERIEQATQAAAQQYRQSWMSDPANAPAPGQKPDASKWYKQVEGANNEDQALAIIRGRLRGNAGNPGAAQSPTASPSGPAPTSAPGPAPALPPTPQANAAALGNTPLGPPTGSFSGSALPPGFGPQAAPPPGPQGQADPLAGAQYAMAGDTDVPPAPGPQGGPDPLMSPTPLATLRAIAGGQSPEATPVQPIGVGPSAGSPGPQGGPQAQPPAPAPQAPNSLGLSPGQSSIYDARKAVTDALAKGMKPADVAKALPPVFQSDDIIQSSLSGKSIDQIKAERAADAESMKAEAEASGKKLSGVVGGVRGQAKLARDTEPMMDAMESLSKLPDFNKTSGWGGDTMQTVARMAAKFGMDPNGATPRQLFDFLSDKYVSTIFSGMKTEAPTLGGDMGRIFQIEAEQLRRGVPTAADGPGGIQAKLSFMREQNERAKELGDKVSDYVDQKGRPDNGIYKLIRDTGDAQNKKYRESLQAGTAGGVPTDQGTSVSNPPAQNPQLDKARGPVDEAEKEQLRKSGTFIGKDGKLVIPNDAIKGGYNDDKELLKSAGIIGGLGAVGAAPAVGGAILRGIAAHPGATALGAAGLGGATAWLRHLYGNP